MSATTYTTFLKCPDQARGRLAGEYPAETYSSFRGILAHRMFARHLNEGAVDAGSFAHACREEIGKSLNPKLAALRLRPSRLGAVIQEVSDLYERFKRFPTEGFAGAELQLQIEALPGVTLRGVVDAVFADGDGVRIVDWKTGSLGSAEPQLDFYALLWALVEGSPPNHIEAVSVATGERYEEAPASGSLNATAQRIAALVTAIRGATGEHDQLERDAGPWCPYCPLLDRCDEGQAASALLR